MRHHQYNNLHAIFLFLSFFPSTSTEALAMRLDLKENRVAVSLHIMSLREKFTLLCDIIREEITLVNQIT